MNKPAATALLILLFSSMFLVFNPVHAVTSVSGSITSDTTWTKANSPYQITSWLTVEEGVTLTIDPGVTVDMNGWYMSVLGRLHAQGKAYDQIHFIAGRTDSFAPGIYLQQQTNSCIIENAVFDKVFLTVRGSTTQITNNIFQRSESAAIKVESSATITGNTFEDIPTEGISVTGTSTVTNNLFNHTTGSATAIIASGTAYIANNQINGFYNGISLYGGNTVENNIVTGCSEYGVLSTYSSATIKGNYVSNNRYGIGGGGRIESNTIVNNDVGISISQEATIKNNNIVSNQNGVTLTIQGTFDARYNYWGKPDSISVSQCIIDSEDTPTLGTVNYQPILTSPSTTAPDDETVKEIAASTGTSGSASLGFLIFLEDNSFVIAEVVILGIIIAWSIVLVAFLIRKHRRTKRV
jgi:parallel beta-helix repeat protein